jgi:hypothetical protein
MGAIDLTDVDLATAATACRAMAYQEGERGQEDGEPEDTRAAGNQRKAIRGPGGEVRGRAQAAV